MMKFALFLIIATTFTFNIGSAAFVGGSSNKIESDGGERMLRRKRLRKRKAKRNPKKEPTKKDDGCVRKEDVVDRIQSFADGVPAISDLYWSNGGGLASNGPNDTSGGETLDACQAAYDAAVAYIESAYAYPHQVLFDPTLTTEPYRFRPTFAGALSYFLGTKCLTLVGDIVFPPGNDDGTKFFEYGFGLRNKGEDQSGWCDVEWYPEEFLYNVGGEEYCQTAVAQGVMCFINCADNSPACVDKTFTFNEFKESGNVVFSAHHSSLSLGVDSPSTSMVCQTAEPAKRCP